MSGKSTMKNFKTMLAEAHLPEKTVEVCLRGDLVAELEELERLLEDAEEQRDRSNSLDAGTSTAELAGKIEALQAEMKEASYAFRLRALPRRDFRALSAEHPPRLVTDAESQPASAKLDDIFQVNYDTFFDALVKRSIVDPQLSAVDYTDLESKLTDNQFEDLALAAWRLNKADVNIPFSSAASRISRSSGSE